MSFQQSGELIHAVEQRVTRQYGFTALADCRNIFVGLTDALSGKSREMVRVPQKH